MRKNSDNDILKISYLRYRNFCNALLRKLKRVYERSQFHKAKNNCKATWEVIKTISNTNKTRESLTELLKLSVDEKASINEVYRYFVNVGKTLASKITPSKEVSHVSDSGSIQYFNNNNSIAILPVDYGQVDTLIARFYTYLFYLMIVLWVGIIFQPKS